MRTVEIPMKIEQQDQENPRREFVKSAMRYAGVMVSVSTLGSVLTAIPAVAGDNDQSTEPEKNTYDQDSILKAASDFFGEATEGLAKVVEKAFKEHGRPNGYIKGKELSGAITVGLRYGDGTLVMKRGIARKVFWQGPSIGFDLGGNASKVFVLVYHLPNVDSLFQRFPSVDGSFYYVGGVGINYQQVDRIILAPIRLGVGLRAGASIGYMHYSRQKTLNPF
jgi:hypothetical protein